MNSVKLQDTKLIFRNWWHFYIPIMIHQKGKLNKQSYLQLHQKYKIPRNKFDQGGKKPVPGKL